MTRLQRRNSSCNCGKTTKESNSFVTKNKTYETRSGVQRKQEGSNGCQKNLPVNTLNLRGKVYLKKMDGPVVSLPIRNGQKMNGTTTIPVIKSSIAKICKKKCVKNDKNGDTKELIDGSLKEIISAKLQVEFIDIETNLKKEDTAISNEILTTKELLVKSLTTNQDKIKNGVFLEINGDTPCEKELIVEKIKNDIVSNEDEPFKNGEVINGFQNIDDKQNDVSFEQTTKKKRKTVKRRTAFELFIKDSCENIGKSVLKDKRARRVPCSFSPESPRKLKETLNPDEQTLIKVEDNQHSDELTLIKVEDIQCSQPVLTKKGLPFKKKGRKPKPKGPIEHYLDVYVKNKEKSCLSKDSSLVIESDIGSNKNNQLDEAKLGIENNESSNETPKQNKVYKNIILPICNATPFRNRHPDLKRKKHEKKSSLKKQKTVDKLNTEEFSSPIIFILGYRINRGQKEMLVQFENGTSNWINYSKHEFDVAKIKEFYEHSDQALSTVNRLGYKTFFPTISVSSLNSDDSDLSSGDESDSNEVFFRSPSLSDSFGINLLQLTDKMPIDVCNIKADALEPDLSNLCNFVMSSKHVKLYPSEKNQEFMVKHDGVFVNIFLKGCLLKDQKKNDSLNQMSCEKLITTLEDCAVDSDCGVAVIYGIEDFFASNSIFEKLLKKTSALEGKKYEGDISMLRYLIQTIRNFNKPIVAVIRKTAMGFPASLLSLFDMVFHERAPSDVEVSKSPSTKKCSWKSTKQPETAVDSDSSCSTAENNFQNFVFPRLIGVTNNNESIVMGEKVRPSSPTDCTKDVACLNAAPLSQQLRNSVRHMRNNCKIQIKRSVRSRSSEASEPEVPPFDDVSEEEDDDVVFNDIAIDNTESVENLQKLERQIQAEKEKTESYMKELFSYLDSLED